MNLLDSSSIWQSGSLLRRWLQVRVLPFQLTKYGAIVQFGQDIRISLLKLRFKSGQHYEYGTLEQWLVRCPFKAETRVRLPNVLLKIMGCHVPRRRTGLAHRLEGSDSPTVHEKHFGSLAQLEERFISTEEVTGPNPVCIHYAALAKMVYARD